MLRHFFKDRSTIFSMLADIFTITGVVYFSWNPFRIIGFYWLDTCVAVIFFLVFFMKSNEINSAATFIFSLSFLFLLMYVYLMSLIYFTQEIDRRADPLDWHILFYPYFDVSVFLILSTFSHYHRLRKMLKLNLKSSLPFNALSTILGMLLVPFILLLSLILNLLCNNMPLAMILSLVILRNIIEFWRFKSIRQIELHLS